ncbi:MAG: sialate O-acetylesterase [Candidatus Methylacidiphilales bacterium]|nr:sialate O-acetylesterase [Candidatus Methylacidiphilales bacterium]
MKKSNGILLLFLFLVGRLGAAELAEVFTPGCVLQRELPLTLWGTGREGEAVTVEIQGKSATTTAKDGRWQVQLPPLAAEASTTLRVRSDKEIVLEDVAVGEVWICSGQSNMEWRLNQCPPHTDALLASADNPRIRQIKVPLRAYAGDPLPKFEWKRFDKPSAPYFSAVAYYFAAQLQSKLDVPVGLVNCAFGGTPIEAWMDADAIRASGHPQMLDEDARKLAVYPNPAAYEEAWQAYNTARKDWEARKKAGTPETELGPQPKEPYGIRTKSRPTTLRSSMLAPVTPYTARGMLWYQGENNAGRKEDYAALLRAFIATCRADWSRPDWPFFIGQIASPTANWPDDQDPYAVIREAQRATAVADAHSGFVVSLDYGERGNVHPIQKQPVGERFARLALARVYGQSVGAAQSASAVRASREGDRVRVEFADLPGKLELRDPALPTLEVGPAAGPWQPVQAVLSPDARQLIVTLPKTTDEPMTLRYAWRNFCALSLYSDEGLPVSPWSLPITAP